MFERLLRIDDFYWSDDVFRPSLGAAAHGTGSLPRLRGRFAQAVASPGGGVTLTRDGLGMNKLFVSVHESGTVLAANYLIDLIRRGVPFECIYSVPAGHVAHIDPRCGGVEMWRFSEPDATAVPHDGNLTSLARGIRAALEVWFARLATQFGRRKICVCLSGGLDSGVIAALATAFFSDVTGYTYAFTEPGTAKSDDAVNAERLADALRLPLRIVPASANDVVTALDDALVYGQDWRDFNVHCAIVNELVARAIRHDRDADLAAAPPLVLTGDLANELVADYTPVTYHGREFYPLPGIDPAGLRRALVRGLDAGDREVGIFSRHGLDLIQPYGLVADEYLRLPGSRLGQPGFKQSVTRLIAGDLLPDFVLDRVKVRAQIGSAAEPTGILPVLLQQGYDGAWLRSAFCRHFGIEREAFLNGFIRAGRYRIVNRFTGGRAVVNGYLAA